MNEPGPNVDELVLDEQHVAAAVHAVRRSQARPADIAAVVGQGSRALATVAALLARGVRKVAVLSEASESRERAARAGALAFSFPSAGQTLAVLQGELGGYGPDIVFGCEVGSEASRLAIELARPAGTIVLMAEDGNPTHMNPNLLVLSDKRVLGNRGFDDQDLLRARSLIAARRLPIAHAGA
jgi:(R,R)-butanediol dehydrogenase/meso-butanediol dehydrogenase/diacetyl reductase